MGLGFGISGVTVAGSRRRAEWGRKGGFGLVTKISTPVENTVEKRPIQGCVAQKTRFLATFQGAKAPGKPGLGQTSWVLV
jgi:hypothetical protein